MLATNPKWIWICAFFFACSTPTIEARPTEPLIELEAVQNEAPEVQFDREEVEDVLRHFARHAQRYFGGEQQYTDGTGEHPWHLGTHVSGDPTTYGMPVAFEQLCYPGGTLFEHEFAKDGITANPTPASNAVEAWFEHKTRKLRDFSVRYSTGQSTGVLAFATFTAVQNGREIARIDIGIREEDHGPKTGEVQFLDP